MRRATFALLCALCLSFPEAAGATLIDRGRGLIYDDVLDVTWLQDASMGGARRWYDAVEWADALVFGGFDDWRLPSMSVEGGVPTGWNSDPAQCQVSNELACRDNELGYMFYHNLGGSFRDDLTGDHDLIMNVQPGYWSGTRTGLTNAWSFFFVRGLQLPLSDGFTEAAWAVRDGDVALPSTLFLLGAGLVGLLGDARRRERFHGPRLVPKNLIG